MPARTSCDGLPDRAHFLSKRSLESSFLPRTINDSTIHEAEKKQKTSLLLRTSLSTKHILEEGKKVYIYTCKEPQKCFPRKCNGAEDLPCADKVESLQVKEGRAYASELAEACGLKAREKEDCLIFMRKADIFVLFLKLKRLWLWA